MRVVVVCSVILATVPAAGEAQRRDVRSGLWLGLGAGYGSTKATCSICGDGQTGLAGQARAGGTLSRSVLVGVEASAWRQRTAPQERRLFMVAAVATYYPARRLGLHGKAGLGQYFYAEEDATTELTTQGLAIQFGAGFDVPVTRGFSITPFVSLIESGFGNPTREDKASGFRTPLLSDMTVRFLQVGLAATLH